MDPFGPQAVATATLAASFLAWRAIRSRNLTTAGAIAGFVVGFLLVATGLRGLTLFVFYQMGSSATKYKRDYKAQLDASTAEHAVRGAGQVLAVSLLAVLLSLWHAYWHGAEQVFDIQQSPVPTRLSAAILAHHATSLADTLASELGLLAKAPPVLVTNGRHVPPGTNGGVTGWGTLTSWIGGALMGATTVALDWLSGLAPSPKRAARMVGFAAVAGALGSLMDSILGATLQATYLDPDTKQVTSKPTGKLVCGRDILTNEQVNLASLVLMTLIGGWIMAPFWF